MLLFVLAFLCGCQNMVPVTHGMLREVPQTANRSIQAADLGENVRKEPPNRIGTHTFSVFGIPAGTIHPEEPIPDTVHPFVVAALEKAGYTVNDIRGKQAANQPIVRGEIKKFWFAGYSWFWPAVVQSGEIEYRLVLQRPDGTVLWEKTFKGKASGARFASDDGYEPMVEKAMTTVLNGVIEAVSSEEFKSAMKKS